MFRTLAKFLFFSFLIFSPNLFCMVCDNRYFPFFPKIHSRLIDKPSWFSFDPFFTTADTAYDDKENEVEIPCLYGKYDQNRLGFAMQKVGLENPMPVDLRDRDIVWGIRQKIQSQGVALSYEQYLFNPVAIGFTWLLMHATSRYEFILEEKHGVTAQGHWTEINDARLKMHKNLGLCEAYSSRTGMGDFDLYIRVGEIWDYLFKCRRIDAGLTLGLLMPAGISVDLSSPTTIPFGGNGHWGMYARVDSEFELKEDIKFGLAMRISKRFEKTRNMRIPIGDEHPLFGVLVAPVTVEPGLHFVFSPYIAFENLRKGLGLRVGLHLSAHEEDSWYASTSCPEYMGFNPDFQKLKEHTNWSSDYISVNVFYDFGKVSIDRGHKPIVTFSWDIPRFIAISENVVRTHRVSLGIEVNF